MNYFQLSNEKKRKILTEASSKISYPSVLLEKDIHAV